VSAVVEGVGDHACEYMTGGRVVVLGKTGRNFGAGMSGGIAYVWDGDGNFASRCNGEMVELEPLSDPEDIAELRALVEQHVAATGSAFGKRRLAGWAGAVHRFVKVIPRDYKRMLASIAAVKAKGLSGSDALMAAFLKKTTAILRGRPATRKGRKAEWRIPSGSWNTSALFPGTRRPFRG
jgi:glutamate synthase (NADPH) large chain